MKIARIFDLLANLKENFPGKQDILAMKSKNGWIKYSVDDYIEKSHAVARGLLSLGLEKDTKIITITSNRPEWNFIDMGSALAGMVHVPVYPTLNHNDFLHIFNHSDAKVIFVGNKNLYNKIAPIIGEMDQAPVVALIDDSSEMLCLSTLCAAGDEHKSEYDEIINNNILNIDPSTCVSIIYTSGTTGTPKGVMLSHRNLMFNSHGHAVRQTFDSSKKMVSMLPLCHIYERSMNYEYQELGISIYYAASVGTFAADLKDCHGDGFCAVPRVLEMMYGKFEAAGKNFTGLKKSIYDWAMDFGNNFDIYNKKPLYLLKRAVADKLVYSKWREQLGGHHLLVVSGGSSIQAKIVRCFNAAKLDIFEGYGMTETSPVIAVNSPADGINIIGTVGKPMDGTEIAFAEDGEILTRGPHVMLGYYKDPVQTAETIDENGFLHTGDIGYLQDGKYLKITDRKKEIFKLSNGKYIAPQVLETKLKELSWVENCIVFGAGQKFASAIICVDPIKIQEIAKLNNISFEKVVDLVSNPEIQKILHNDVLLTNKNFAEFEQIKKEQFIIEDWSTQNNLLSQTLKLKRISIMDRYKTMIDNVYN